MFEDLRNAFREALDNFNKELERDQVPETVDGLLRGMTAEAKEKRGSLGASAGRTGARRAISEADDLFSELDRMADKMEGGRARAEAAEAFDELDLEGPSAADFEEIDAPPPDEELDVDAALAELKRRMGRQ